MVAEVLKWGVVRSDCVQGKERLQLNPQLFSSDLFHFKTMIKTMAMIRRNFTYSHMTAPVWPWPENPIRRFTVLWISPAGPLLHTYIFSPSHRVKRWTYLSVTFSLFPHGLPPVFCFHCFPPGLFPHWWLPFPCWSATDCPPAGPSYLCPPPIRKPKTHQSENSSCVRAYTPMC